MLAIVILLSTTAHAEGPSLLLPEVPTSDAPKPYLPPFDAKKNARQDLVVGGIALSAGVAMLVGTVIFAVSNAQYRSPPLCAQGSSLCFNDVDDSLQQVSVTANVVLGLAGTATTVVGAVMLAKGADWAKRARVTPLVAAGPNGGSLGLIFHF